MKKVKGTWISFTLIGQKPKTQVWIVDTNPKTTIGKTTTIGTIKWYPRWRRYAFYPWSQTIYETTCLKEIANFLIKLTNDRKKAKE